MAQRQQLRQQPSGEAAHAGLDQVDADLLEVAQADLDRRNAQVVERAVLESRFPLRQHVHRALHGGEIDGAAGEPGPPQLRQRGVADEQAAHAGGIAEHLVEGDRHEVGPHGTQVEAVGGHEGGCVEQHVPAGGLGLPDQRQRMLHAREIGLRRKSQQVVAPRLGLRQLRGHGRGVDAQVGSCQWRVVDAGALGARELAHAVDRVVVVGRHQQPRAVLEREGLGHQLQGARGVEREDRRVFALGVEMGQNGRARALDAPRRLGRTRAGRVRVAEHVRVEHFGMLAHLRCGVQSATCVVQVSMLLRVEPAVLRATQFVQRDRGRVVRVLGQETFESAHRFKSNERGGAGRAARCRWVKLRSSAGTQAMAAKISTSPHTAGAHRQARSATPCRLRR